MTRGNHDTRTHTNDICKTNIERVFTHVQLSLRIYTQTDYKKDINKTF